MLVHFDGVEASGGGGGSRVEGRQGTYLKHLKTTCLVFGCIWKMVLQGTKPSTSFHFHDYFNQSMVIYSSSLTMSLFHPIAILLGGAGVDFFVASTPSCSLNLLQKQTPNPYTQLSSQLKAVEGMLPSV